MTGRTTRPLSKTTISLVETSLGNPAARQLEAAQTAEIAARYGSYAPGLLDPACFAPPDGGFLLAWAGTTTVGGGGFRRHGAELAELKLLRVEPAWRRHGIARMLLGAIEAAAAAAGYRGLVLESGTGQPEALALYRAAGYRPIPPYGPDRDLPAVRCLAKDLAPGSARGPARLTASSPPPPTPGSR